jgi:hypothetical protein
LIQARHHAEVRRQLKNFGGHEVDTAGDGFLMELTGLSQFHRRKVRKGERPLHARHWDAVAKSDPTERQTEHD